MKYVAYKRMSLIDLTFLFLAMRRAMTEQQVVSRTGVILIKIQVR